MSSRHISALRGADLLGGGGAGAAAAAPDPDHGSEDESEEEEEGLVPLAAKKPAAFEVRWRCMW